MFVLKSGAGFSIFKWIATLAADFLEQALAGATFFFDAETIGRHWFFVNTVSMSAAFRWRDFDEGGCSFPPSFSLSHSYK